MYEGAEFETVVEQLTDDVLTLDLEGVKSDISGEVGDRTANMQLSPHEGSIVYINGNEGDRYFYVSFHYDLIIDLALELRPSRITEIREAKWAREYSEQDIRRHVPDDVELVDGPEHQNLEGESEPRLSRDAIAAALDFVNNVDSDLNEEIVYNLVDIFSRVPVKFRVHSNENYDGLTGLTVRNRIFPYEESFSISKLNNAIVEVKAPGQMGMLFYQKAFGLNTRDDKPKSESDGPNRPKIPR